MHRPVLLNEVLNIFNPQPGECYIDATVNGGGHAMAILERVGSTGRVLGIDWDCDLIEKLNAKSLAFNAKNLELTCGNYVNIRDIARRYHMESVDGVLFDCGFSSYHVEESERGFSFLGDEPLDMRYSTIQNSKFKNQNDNVKFKNITASDIVNTFSKEDLEKILRDYGEERFSKKIAKEICAERRKRRITTTEELVAVIKRAVPRQYTHGRIHPATRTFQALRIAVNDELNNLSKALVEATTLLKPSKGILAAIAFHSLEDRIVKNFFRDGLEKGEFSLLNKKPIVASELEINNNPRARSAKLRAGVRKS